MMTTDTDPTHAYALLTPDAVLDAVDSVAPLVGGHSDGRQLALNSYENRVYQVGIEEAAPVIVKFYRPQRWTDAAIQEEHDFAAQLAQAEIPAVAPLRDASGRSLFEHGGFRFALYPRRGGRTPDLENPDHLLWVGRFLGRIHAIGATSPFRHRPSLSIDSFGHEPFRYILSTGFVPDDLREAYTTLVEDVLKQVVIGFERAGALEGKVLSLRLHGDCHPGNILWTDDGPHFVDFDDARMGPAIQDLWMLLSGDRRQMTGQLDELLAGYSEFMDFNPRELHLIEPLRSLRMIHYSAWLARRWDDPTFPMHFPWFGEARYWEEQILALREQAAIMMNEAPLQWMG
ncbi:MAG: serine/threonine protein kinase [Gammaproteobacteria bacterium]|nr:serine/threonine protein kinase [Gammaproteobacteria bacterium]